VLIEEGAGNREQSAVNPFAGFRNVLTVMRSTIVESRGLQILRRFNRNQWKIFHWLLLHL